MPSTGAAPLGFAAEHIRIHRPNRMEYGVCPARTSGAPASLVENIRTPIRACPCGALPILRLIRAWMDTMIGPRRAKGKRRAASPVIRANEGLYMAL